MDILIILSSEDERALQRGVSRQRNNFDDLSDPNASHQNPPATSPSLASPPKLPWSVPTLVLK